MAGFARKTIMCAGQHTGLREDIDGTSFVSDEQAVPVQSWDIEGYGNEVEENTLL